MQARANFFFLLVSFAGAQAASPNLMPMPAKLVLQSGGLPINSGFQVRIAGISDPRLTAAAQRLTARVIRQTGLSLIAQKAAHPALTIQCREAGPAYPALGDDESYTLDATPEGAHLSATTVTGALRGMETFLQLIAPGPDGFAVPSIHIEDRPRFPWRGLMMDVARHWMPVEVVLRNLDAMAAVKLNVFH